jgi:ferrous iron transport protein B
MEKKLNIVLAGQANVGKSVIFNHLTGLHQHIGNWPGKTVEKAEGTLHYKGYTIDLLDLPGIYSLSTYSLEELISREYIAVQKPDFIINVLDATHLERNLIFTLQVLELERPTVLALNMDNLLKKKGIEINYKKLEEILGVPVVPVAAIYGKGLTETLDRGIKIFKKGIKKKPGYGREVEMQISKLSKALKGVDADLPYPRRWTAIKLLEKDKKVEKAIRGKKPEMQKKVKEMRLELEKIHGHDSSVVIAGERCHLVSRIISKVVRLTRPEKNSFGKKLDFLTSHKIWGYPIMIAILTSMFLAIFSFGDWLSSLLGDIASNWQTYWGALFGFSIGASLGWSAVESVLALVEIAFPYIIPFYIFLFILEGWGYLARIAFLTDNLMHKMGIHGKACVPLILGFGCNVPACLSCRIMETERERFITGFLTTMVPCSALSVIAMGLVGKFVGMSWVIGLYGLIALIIFGLGWLISKTMPGEPVELIMEMPDYKFPNIKTIILQTWSRLKEFILIAAPLVIISGIIINGFYLAGWLRPIADLLSPVTVKWLGLPAITGILLIFGILRKELILVMLAMLLGTTNFAEVLTPVQMLTLALVSMLYIPCVATIAALKKEFGWRRALGISLFKIVFAVIAGGLFFRFLISI